MVQRLRTDYANTDPVILSGLFKVFSFCVIFLIKTLKHPDYLNLRLYSSFEGPWSETFAKNSDPNLWLFGVIWGQNSKIFNRGKL